MSATTQTVKVELELTPGQWDAVDAVVSAAAVWPDAIVTATTALRVGRACGYARWLQRQRRRTAAAHTNAAALADITDTEHRIDDRLGHATRDWTHALCEGCFRAISDDVADYVADDPLEVTCCGCLDATTTGRYLCRDPQEVPRLCVDDARTIHAIEPPAR